MKIVRPLCIVMLIFLMSHTSLAQERYQTVNQEELYRLIGEWKVDSNERELYSTLRFFVHFSSSVSGIKLGTLWSIFQDKKRQPLPLVTEYALKRDVTICTMNFTLTTHWFVLNSMKSTIK